LIIDATMMAMMMTLMVIVMIGYPEV